MARIPQKCWVPDVPPARPCITLTSQVIGRGQAQQGPQFIKSPRRRWVLSTLAWVISVTEAQGHICQSER